MSNPFPRAASGSYKNVLIEGLTKIGEDKVAIQFAKGNMKLAIASSIYGNVKLFPELKEVCLKALESLEPNGIIRYYFWGIANGDFLIASSDVSFVYDPTDAKAVAYNEVMKAIDSAEVPIKILQSPYFN
jgi:hypothetical protein